ncbi:bacillithiol system redox-active protein YtxJ [Alicyclobacillus macrosporangiidus]|jgi:bacillithiol system protein YtxJ|uniref:Bacillithiol system protein YtxJ n=1 Tax=Alicyclobacillus macrosporangiidus TaxID=392015 RepID=A0A1I7JP30_9BACL|nr:bacillithiol system redox-active protein YtxJ [Alicyclobacillus macrosporangiidus]SFU86911.1 bacillithiol system protein YtxJ [Alicyclobacillus macrosporangiidus]
MSRYQELTTLDQWAQVYEASRQQPTLVFKHSTTCPISANAHREFERYLETAPEGTAYVLVKVIESRPVSNQIAQDLGVVHQSPQAILIRDGQPVWHASHWDITAARLREAVEGASAADAQG